MLPSSDWSHVPRDISPDFLGAYPSTFSRAPFDSRRNEILVGTFVEGILSVVQLKVTCGPGPSSARWCSRGSISSKRHMSSRRSHRASILSHCLSRRRRWISRKQRIALTLTGHVGTRGRSNRGRSFTSR